MGRPRLQRREKAPRDLGDAAGTIEPELFPGDAPLGVDHFIRVVESGEIVGTEFGRVVPNFVAQQRAIRDGVTLRDEVSRHGLPRSNLSWASAGLDTGRPGYTRDDAAAAQRRELHRLAGSPPGWTWWSGSSSGPHHGARWRADRAPA